MTPEDVVIKIRPVKRLTPGSPRYVLHHEPPGEMRRTVGYVEKIGKWWYLTNGPAGLDGRRLAKQRFRLVARVRSEVYEEIQRDLNWKGEPSCPGYYWDFVQDFDGPVLKCTEHHGLPIFGEVYELSLNEEDLRFPCVHYADLYDNQLLPEFREKADKRYGTGSGTLTPL